VIVAKTVPVLLYHSVCADPAPLMRDWSTTPERFRDHLAMIKREGYEALTVSDYAARLRSAAPHDLAHVVVITFDDGFADFVESAAPALLEAGIPSTLYVSTAYVGATSSWLGPDGEQKMLTWDMIAELPTFGVEIGAHAHHHVALDELDPAEAQVEIVQSKNLLENAIGTPIESFAYPHGYHGRAVKEMVRLAGFTNACGVKHALSGPGDDLFGLARIIVPHEADGDALLGLMKSMHRATRYETPKTKAWRVVRRSKARHQPHVHRAPTGST
jgi:peptidoglycan/xylan/chitin deacetylase (PgdA/CDA1 family)